MAVYNGGGFCYVTVCHNFLIFAFVFTVKCVRGEVLWLWCQKHDNYVVCFSTGP